MTGRIVFEIKVDVEQFIDEFEKLSVKVKKDMDEAIKNLQEKLWRDLVFFGGPKVPSVSEDGFLFSLHNHDVQAALTAEIAEHFGNIPVRVAVKEMDRLRPWMAQATQRWDRAYYIRVSDDEKFNVIAEMPFRGFHPEVEDYLPVRNRIIGAIFEFLEEESE